MLHKQWFNIMPTAGVGVLFAISVVTSFQSQAESVYYRTNSSQSSNLPSKVYYPSAQRGAQHESIVTVTNAKTGAHVVLGGTVKPYREVTLTAQMPGRVEFIAGSEGDWFDEGQILVAIDDDDVMAQRHQAVADLYGRTSSLKDARAQYSREFWAPQALQQQQQTAPSMGYFLHV